MANAAMTVVPAPKYPWDWTSHDVVEYLARRTHLEIYFKSEPLRATFIENEINGLVLLDESFTEQTLRNDLGIKQVGIRIGIWRVINDLRQTYHRRPSIDLLDNLLLPPPDSPRDDSPEILQVPETTVINFGPLNAQLVVPEVHRSAALFSTPGPSRLITRTPHSIFKEKEDVPIEAEHSIQSFDLPTPESPTPLHEGQEHSDSDEELPLSQALSNVNIHNDDDVSTLGSTEMELSFSESVRVDGLEGSFNGFIATNNADEVDMAEATQLPESIPVTPQPSPKHVPRELQIKRVPKRPLAKSSSPVEGHSPRRRRTSKAKPYLRHESLTAQDITIVANVSDSGNFVIHGGKPVGNTRSVNGLMKARLRTKVVNKNINGKRHIAYANITVRHIQKHQRNPITIINEDEGVRLGQDIKRHIHEFPELDVVGQVYRQKKDRAAFLDLVSEKNDMRLIDPHEPAIGDGYYDDLKEKHMAEQSRNPTHVPIQYGSEDESPDFDSDTLREIEHDRNPKPPPSTPNRKQLTIEQIQNVWEDAKKAVIEKWQEDRLPLLERMKYGIWKRARKGEYDEPNRNAREEIGKNILKELELKDRLEAQLVKFCDVKWYSASKLQRQMKSNSGRSIRDLEEYTWRISIILGKRPPKPPPRQRPRMSQVIPASQPFEPEGDNMDGEDLGDEDSSMEESDELDEGLDGFIVDDDVYDSGHENLRAANEAVLAEHKNRFQKAAADVVMDEADSQIEETIPGPDIVLSDARRPTPADTEDAMVTGVSEDEDVPTEARPMSVDKGKGVAKKNSDSWQWFDNFADHPPAAHVLEETTAISLLEDVDFVHPSISGPFTITYDETPGESSNRLASTSPVKIKTERASPSAPLIAVTSPVVIDLTMDTPPASSGLPAASTSKSASGHRNPELLKMIELDSESDLQTQKAIENSLRERDTNSIPRALLQQSTPSSSSVPTRPKERLNICPASSESLAWMKALQHYYTKKPETMNCMRDVAKRVTNERTSGSLETRLVMFLEGMAGEKTEITSLGLTPEETWAHRFLARVYFKWSFPDKKVGKLEKDQGARLISKMNVDRFLRELTPILDRIVEYEGTIPSEPAIERQSPVTDFMILDHENTEDGSTNKGKGKERASLLSLSPPPESDTEQPARDFSQSSARHSSPPDSQGSKPRHVVKHREVKESAATVAHRETQKKEMKNTRKRALQQEKSGKKGEIINLGHYAGYDPVYFPSFSKLEQLYEFQKEGIQFLWESLILAKKRHGALLAHTMGMGKTRQVATFLGAYAETAQSENPRMSRQIPDQLKHVRVVVVAPAGLLDNWDEEITKWRIDYLQRVYVISSKTKSQEQSDMIEEWANDGTTLLIGYETLRSLIKKSPEHSPVSASKNPKATKEPKQNLCDEELAHNNHIADLLLSTPSIVVADEAHRIKNSDSDLAKIFSKFKTKTRIAMTGSPLSNNLTDYYNLIKWVDAEYVGNKEAFNSNFKFPILDGLFHDSLPEEVSRSKVLQKRLITAWGPKMHRVSLANLQDIRNMLPDKTEFMITLPLTELQYEIYDLYTSKVRRKIRSEVSNFFKFIQELSVLLSHPEILWNSLQEKFTNSNTSKTIAPARKEGSRVSIASPDPTSADDDISNSEDLMAETTEENTLGEVEGSIFTNVKAIVERRGRDLSRLTHSYRIVALLKILDSCIKINEKVLVFSQSVKTLNYIADILTKRDIAFKMLHGEVKSGKRQQITREFSSSNTYVFLISTKAGGLGLNIQSASRIILFDCLFSPQDEEQAVGRAYRLGQKKHVFVYRFRVGGTYEDIIHNNSMLKMSLAMRMLDKKEPRREAKKTKVQDWFNPPRILEDVDMDLESFRGKDRKVLDGLLGEPWLMGLQTQNTYEMHQDEPLTEEEQREYDRMVKEDEARRNSATDAAGTAEISETVPTSTPKRVPSTVDAAGEPSRPPLTTPKPRKKRDSATGPPATPVTPSIARSQASPSNSGSPVLVLR